MDRTVVHEPLTVAQSVAQHSSCALWLPYRSANACISILSSECHAEMTFTVSIFTVDMKWHVSPGPLGALAFVHCILCCRAIGRCFDCRIFFNRANAVTVAPFAAVDLLRANVSVPSTASKTSCCRPFGACDVHNLVQVHNLERTEQWSIELLNCCKQMCPVFAHDGVNCESTSSATVFPGPSPRLCCVTLHKVLLSCFILTVCVWYSSWNFALERSWKVVAGASAWHVTVI